MGGGASRSISFCTAAIEGPAHVPAIVHHQLLENQRPRRNSFPIPVYRDPRNGQSQRPLDPKDLMSSLNRDQQRSRDIVTLCVTIVAATTLGRLVSSFMAPLAASLGTVVGGLCSLLGCVAYLRNHRA
jgi:hypothetical protein